MPLRKALKCDIPYFSYCQQMPRNEQWTDSPNKYCVCVYILLLRHRAPLFLMSLRDHKLTHCSLLWHNLSYKTNPQVSWSQLEKKTKADTLLTRLSVNQPVYCEHPSHFTESLAASALTHCTYLMFVHTVSLFNEGFLQTFSVCSLSL